VRGAGPWGSAFWGHNSWAFIDLTSKWWVVQEPHSSWPPAAHSDPHVTVSSLQRRAHTAQVLNTRLSSFPFVPHPSCFVSQEILACVSCSPGRLFIYLNSIYIALLYSSSWPETHYIDQAGPKLVILQADTLCRWTGPGDTAESHEEGRNRAYLGSERPVNLRSSCH
jgi:hypothetical protein